MAKPSKSALPPPNPPTFLTLNGVARLVGRHRNVIQRLALQGEVSIDAYVDLDGSLQPLFRPEAAIILSALVGPPQHTTSHQPEILA